MNQNITVLGQTNFRGQKRAFGIYDDDRRRHIYVIGKTGVGKSTILENLAAQDIANGKGLCFVDPHGDAVESLLNAVPPERINDVIYFDPSDVDFPVAFNVLEAPDPQYKYLVASGLVSSLKKIWADSWGPRLEYILRNTILALLDYPGSTILGILRMLSDKGYRKKVITFISDPVVKSFWIDEFANYNERFRSEAISPIQNKVGQLLSSAIIRNIMAQPKSTINVHEAMNEGKILLINVSKGKIGEDNSALLGAMIINRIQLAAMDRASMAESERRDFYLYVDEFQNFATESFADILSEARKYRLNLTIAHQYVAQMEEEVSDAVFGNVGTLISFRVGATDAEYLEKEFTPVFTQTDLVNLDKYQAYIKLMINGINSRPFSMRTLPPSMENYDKKETVRLVSRERYGRKREIVEEKIRRWSGPALSEKGDEENRTESRSDRPPREQYPRREERPRKPAPVNAAALEDVTLTTPQPITDLAAILKPRSTDQDHSPRRENSSQESHAITCARCGREADVPFKPDPNREVFCKECLAIVRQERRQSAPSPQAPLQERPPEPERPRSRQAPAVPQTTQRQWRGPKPPPLP